VTTPATVENFLSYVNSGAYNNSIIHRSVPGFVIQGGGSFYDFSILDNIETTGTVNNEPVYANVRGTIAMAKQPGLPNSASSQYFFNLSNNNANLLDGDNGGFTVFGQVIGEGMAVVDAMAAIPRFNASTSLPALPLRNFSPDSTGDLTENNFIMINSIQIVDAATDTATALTRPVTTRSAGGGGNPTTDGGGHFGLWGLLMLGIASVARRLGK
jgi:peptidyl-prolyl cis-trans isomerase A (cyclophilin A)